MTNSTLATKATKSGYVLVLTNASLPGLTKFARTKDVAGYMIALNLEQKRDYPEEALYVLEHAEKVLNMEKAYQALRNKFKKDSIYI